MIVHIVMWRVIDSNGSSKAETSEKIKSLLETLPGLVTHIDLLRAGINVMETANSSDIVLYSEFRDMDALNAYQQHPAHVKVATQINVLVSERRVVDFTVEC